MNDILLVVGCVATALIFFLIGYFTGTMTVLNRAVSDGVLIIHDDPVDGTQTYMQLNSPDIFENKQRYAILQIKRSTHKKQSL